MYIYIYSILAVPAIDERVTTSSVCTDPVMPESTQILTEPSPSLTDWELLNITTTASDKGKKMLLYLQNLACIHLNYNNTIVIFNNNHSKFSNSGDKLRKRDNGC